MKRTIIIIGGLFITVLILYLSFGFNNEDYLGDNYYYLPKYEAIDIGYSGGSIIYKSSKKNVFADVKVPNEVIMVKKNKNYIIAIQQDIIDKGSSLSSKILNRKILNYYIIDKHTDIIYGPYTKTGYLKKRKEIKIPHTLRFRDD